jgi:hypothetical protein
LSLTEELLDDFTPTVQWFHHITILDGVHSLGAQQLVAQPRERLAVAE